MKQDELGNISYHAFPDVKSVKGKQWIQRIHRDPGTNFVVNPILQDQCKKLASLARSCKICHHTRFLIMDSCKK